MTVAGILLAAGGGRRFGQPKATAVLGGSSLADRGVKMLLDAGCAPVVLVAGAGADSLRPPAEATLVVNEHWAQGLSTSLRTGLAFAATTPAEAAVLALVDQPLVSPAAVQRLVGAWRKGAVVAAAAYGGKARNPVLLDRSVWADVTAASTGDEGARAWLQAHPDLVTPVACDDVSDPDDIDTPADLDRIARRLG